MSLPGISLPNARSLLSLTSNLSQWEALPRLPPRLLRLVGPHQRVRLLRPLPLFLLTAVVLLRAVLASAPPDPDFDSDEEYHWDGDEFGSDYTPPLKLNGRVAPYSPSCSHVSVLPSFSAARAYSPADSPSPARVPDSISHLLKHLADSPVASPVPTGRLAVADTGATDHMLPDKSSFIYYKSVVDLSVRMGNNSYVPVLGRGTAIFALNGKQMLIRNVLHVPGLAIPLYYSLRTHVTQRGCGFFGTQESGFLVYFPTFILLVDPAVDCHLSFEPLGTSAPLHTLQYVQPRCAPTSSPAAAVTSVSPPSSNQFLPPLIESDDSVGDDTCVNDLTDEPLTFAIPMPKVSPPSSSDIDLSSISCQLE